MGNFTQAECLVFDFDGTLFNLDCDWQGMKNALGNSYPTINFKSLIGGLTQIETELGPQELAKAYSIVEAFEADGNLSPIQAQINILREALSEGKPIAIFTSNCYATVKKALESIGVDVPIIVSGDSCPVRKPDPAGLLIALDELGAKTHQALYIADGDQEEQTAARVGVQFQRAA